MTAALPNPFEFESAASSSPTVNLTAHVDHAAVLLSRAKATEGKAGMAGATGTVRRSTAGTGLRVGVADAVLPATSEFMDVTAGETAPNSETTNRKHSSAVASGTAREAPSGSVIGPAPAAQSARPATNSRDDVSTSEEFFPYRFGRKAAPSPIPSAEVTAELEAGIADIVAGLAASKSAPLFLRDPSPEYLAANSSHMAFRSFASNSTFNFPSSVKA